jgi:hypothetical protein
MTDAEKDGRVVVAPAAVGAKHVSTQASGSTVSKRPYSTPKLTSLGRVTEVTFTKSKGPSDGGSARHFT